MCRKTKGYTNLVEETEYFWSKNRIFSKVKQIMTNCEARKIWNSNGIFKDTNLNIANESKRHLGALVGTEEFRKEYVIMRANKELTKLKLLAKIAKFYPQATYCAFTSSSRP